MTLDILEAFRGAFDRSTTRTGGVMAAGFLLVNIINTVSIQSFATELVTRLSSISGFVVASEPAPLALQLPLAVSGIGIILGAIASLLLGIFAARALYVDSLEKEYLTQNLARTALNLVLGSIVFSVMIFVAILFGVLPGVYLFSALFLWNLFVVLDGQSFVEGLRSSWTATRNDSESESLLKKLISESNRFRVVVAFLLLGVGTSAVTSMLTIPVDSLAPETITALWSTVPSSVLGVYSISFGIELYEQLR